MQQMLHCLSKALRYGGYLRGWSAGNKEMYRDSTSKPFFLMIKELEGVERMLCGPEE